MWRRTLFSTQSRAMTASQKPIRVRIGSDEQEEMTPRPPHVFARLTAPAHRLDHAACENPRPARSGRGNVCRCDRSPFDLRAEGPGQAAFAVENVGADRRDEAQIS